jgi:polyisoprenoid-binding protein YceI
MIQVDASDLTTDDNRRNGRIRNDILRSGQADYQYITFQPTTLSGLPASVTEGEPFTFQATGDLTILGAAVPVTFDMTVTPVSTSELTGSGRATIRYADFGISIPSVPMVAGVSDDVQLEIDFTAQAAS